MSSEESLNSVKLASEDQEIPDRATAQAAEWLSAQNVGFDTPTFWLVAGLLKLYTAAERDAERERCCWDVCPVCDGKIPSDCIAKLERHGEHWIHVIRSKYTDNVVAKDCDATAIRSRAAKGED